LLTKPLIDVDPELLRRSAVAQLHAFAEVADHLAKEETGHIPTILDTLVPGGPWAWAIVPFAHDDGSIDLPLKTTHEGIEEMYGIIRGHSDVLSTEIVAEVRGTWFVFAEAFSRMRVKQTGVEGAYEMVLMLPVTSGPGITGEIAFWNMGREVLGKDLPLAPALRPIDMRRHLVALHDEYLDAFRIADAHAMSTCFSQGCQGAVRDYVNDTGTLTLLDDLDGMRRYYQAFFDLYDVQTVEVLERIAQDWYLFAEVRVEAVARASDRGESRVAFHVGELFIPGRENKFIVHLGHGTDLAASDVDGRFQPASASAGTSRE
jgi:hypothetical protein